MGKRERRKGVEGEREFFAELSRLTGVTVSRRLGQARDGGADGLWRGVVWEVKRRRRVTVCRWIEQALKAAREEGGGRAVVAFREDGRKQWCVAMTLEAFLYDYRP